MPPPVILLGSRRSGGGGSPPSLGPSIGYGALVPSGDRQRRPSRRRDRWMDGHSVQEDCHRPFLILLRGKVPARWSAPADNPHWCGGTWQGRSTRPVELSVGLIHINYRFVDGNPVLVPSVFALNQNLPANLGFVDTSYNHLKINYTYKKLLYLLIQDFLV